MDWQRLLSRDRFIGNGEAEPMIDRPISQFQLDAERILYTSSFRRLQGKTQVYPLPVYDYLRTRLTHTNEVAFVGKTIARNIAREITDELGDITADDISDVTYAACLAHDLGNPPFGHIGEDAIQTWFAKKAKQSSFSEVLDTSKQKYDFLHFDGNAQGFRIMTRLSSWREEGGMRLTYAVLGAFSKYPFPSRHTPSLENKGPNDKEKKFGFMQEDSVAALKVFKALGMNEVGEHAFCRHPLAFLVEAADDISYLTTDIEDAHRVRQLDFPEAERLLWKIVECGKYSDSYKAYRAGNEQDKISFLRSLASATLIDGMRQTFLDNKDDILAGKFKSPLVDASKFHAPAREIRKRCNEKIYFERNKIQLEAAGFNVILGLMDLFGGMIEEYLAKKGNVEKMDKKDQNLFHLLPEESRNRLQGENVYRCMVVLMDYIAGMTDRFALDLYQRLCGHSSAIGKMA